jgi:hypothetical protein
VTSLPTQSARIGDLPVERVMNAQFFRTPAGQLVLLVLLCGRGEVVKVGELPVADEFAVER